MNDKEVIKKHFIEHNNLISTIEYIIDCTYYYIYDVDITFVHTSTTMGNIFLH